MPEKIDIATWLNMLQNNVMLITGAMLDRHNTRTTSEKIDYAHNLLTNCIHALDCIEIED